MLYRTTVLKISSHFSWLISYIWHKIFNHHHIFPAWASLSHSLVWILHLWAFTQSGKVGFWGSPKISAGAALSRMGFPEDRCWGCCSLLYTGPHWGQSSTHIVFQTSVIQMTPSCSCCFSLMSLQSLTRSQTVSQTHPHVSKSTTSNFALVKQSSRFSQPSNSKWWTVLLESI